LSFSMAFSSTSELRLDAAIEKYETVNNEYILYSIRVGFVKFFHISLSFFIPFS